MEVRRFKEEDAPEIVTLVCRNFLEVNSRDYPLAEMEQLANGYTVEKVKRLAANGHTYVVCHENHVVATGTISAYWGSNKESILLTIFVLPEYHGKGIGKLLIETLEQDVFFLRANRIEIPASITACGFYEKMGYGYKNNCKELDAEHHYPMEKFR